MLCRASSLSWEHNVMLIHIKFVLSICLSHTQYINVKSLFVFGILAGVGVNVCQLLNGPVYAHFIGDVITAPLILDNT